MPGPSDSSLRDTFRLSCFLTWVCSCRPYFMCLLGNRYGWSQPIDKSRPKDQLLARTFENAYGNFSWTEKYADRSITELEVRTYHQPNLLTSALPFFGLALLGQPTGS